MTKHDEAFLAFARLFVSKSYQKIIEELVEGPKTNKQLADKTGLSLECVVQALHTMRKSGRRFAHIAEWKRAKDGYGKAQAVFAIGDKPDAEDVPPVRKRNRARRLTMKMLTKPEKKTAPLGIKDAKAGVVRIGFFGV